MAISEASLAFGSSTAAAITAAIVLAGFVVVA